jgi:hypothetical protein
MAKFYYLKLYFSIYLQRITASYIIITRQTVGKNALSLSYTPVANSYHHFY